MVEDGAAAGDDTAAGVDAAGVDHDGSARDPEDRGVSEFSGVAILVTFTLLVTGSVGLMVLVDPGSEDRGPNANFTFQYIDQSSVLIVTHDRGDTFTARNLSIRSQGTTVTWAALANTENSTAVGPGSTIQLSRRNAFGSPIPSGGRARVLYKPPAGNETVLETWRGIG